MELRAGKRVLRVEDRAMGRRAVAAQPSILDDQPLAPFLQHLCSLS